MKSVKDELEQRVSEAMKQYAPGTGVCPAIVRPSTDPKFGDYQVNGVMALAKQLKTDPRKLAVQVVKNLDVSDMCEQPEIAGPGFINLRLKTEFIAQRLLEIFTDPNKRFGIDKADKARRIVVDFSGPNIAKQMHVGHLRSTIIGDCICRTLEFAGHTVNRQNHIGDWGTHFGMLTCYFYKLHEKEVDEKFNKGITGFVTDWSIPDIESFYKAAKELFDSDQEFRKKSRDYIVALHSANKTILSIWQYLVDESRKHYQPIYDELGVSLQQKDERGESCYADMLPDVVNDLQKGSVAEESEGAICVFPPGFKNKEGEPLAFIIQKSDGAYLYATTDLAALRYRINQLKADRIIYVTDARQKLHFEMLFSVARMAGWASEKIDLVHVTFGSVLGENAKPLKTREGENVKLKDLLDEAVVRSRAIVEQKNPGLSEDKKREIANAVGIGAVKYADFSNNRTSDYTFSFDKMLAMDGNTAPYMQYAYARIKSIEREAIKRKAAGRDVDIEKELRHLKQLNLDEPAEIDLAKHIIRYCEAIGAALADYRPNYITAYLYDLAQKFSAFYNACPVLAADKDKRPTRLLLCDLTAKIIRHGLTELLGIDVVKQM